MSVLLLAVALLPNKNTYGQEKRQADSATTQPAGLRVFILDPRLLERARQQVRAGDVAVAAAMKQLKREAEYSVKDGLFTVIDEPTPPSGDKHDYMSLSIYWWPNPDAKAALRSPRRPGEPGGE